MARRVQRPVLSASVEILSAKIGRELSADGVELRGPHLPGWIEEPGMPPRAMLRRIVASLPRVHSSLWPEVLRIEHRRRVVGRVAQWLRVVGSAGADHHHGVGLELLGVPPSLGLPLRRQVALRLLIRSPGACVSRWASLVRLAPSEWLASLFGGVRGVVYCCLLGSVRLTAVLGYVVR
jgi:hypothetical protein